MGAEDQGAVITITRRNLAWAIAGILTMLSGGNVVGMRMLGPGEEIGPLKADIAALSARVDELAKAQDELADTNLRRQMRIEEVLHGVLTYQIEAARDARSYRPRDHEPSPELVQAEERLRVLSRK